jgi:antitoxin ParD1/3/4
MHISLTNNLEELVTAKVNSGMYNNASEVIAEALRLLDKFEKAQDIKLELLQQAVNIGIFQAENNIFSEKSILDLIDDE